MDVSIPCLVLASHSFLHYHLLSTWTYVRPIVLLSSRLPTGLDYLLAI